MRVLLMVPGSGGTFYCQNCLRDYALLRALRREGHDAVMLPLYLPAFDASTDPSLDAPVFFGGISAFLREQCGLFRWAPRWLDRLLDHPWMLKQAAAREGSTNAAELGPMTLSMLRGREGNQRREFDRLIEWTTSQERFDVFHISNALLLGFAPEMRRATGVPIVCSLQDEEPWVDAMRAPYGQLCWQAMAKAAVSVDQFVTTSAWYAGRMSERLGIPRDVIRVIHLGVETEGVVPAPAVVRPRTIGYLSRLNEGLGFGSLVDTFIELHEDPAMSDVRLRATGGITPADKPFVAKNMAKLRAAGLEHTVDILEDFSKPHRAEFLRSLSLLSVPTPKGEAFGVQLLEAMLYGVPVVQPSVGAYPEVIAATRGGIVYDAEEPRGLANALRTALSDPVGLRALGEKGRESVLADFDIARVARDFAAVYEDVAKAR